MGGTSENGYTNNRVGLQCEPSVTIRDSKDDVWKCSPFSNRNPNP